MDITKVREALKSKYTGCGDNGKMLLCYNDEQINTVKDIITDCERLLKKETPPTSEYVCEKLSEHLEFNVKYKSDKELFYDSEEHAIKVHGLPYIAQLQKNKTLHISWSLPPHLIELIGRFYMGLEK